MTRSSHAGSSSEPLVVQPLVADPVRVEELFRAHQQQIYRGAERVFAQLMTAQWVAGILFAVWVSPRAWAGTISQTHVHVWAAVVLGGLITAFPVVFAFLNQGGGI